MELSDSLSHINSMKMGCATRLLVNCPSIEVSNLLDFLKYGVTDCRILSIFGLALRQQGGALVPMLILVMLPMVPVLSLEAEVEDFLIPP